MALVKNQQAPWGDYLFYESENEEVRFGEVYREFLQEAWKKDNEPQWFQIGVKTHGPLPPQQGILNPNLTERQVYLRTFFRD